MHTIHGEFSVECEMKRLPGILIAWEQYHNSQQYYIHTSNLSVHFLVLFAYYIILSVRAADILHTQPMMNAFFVQSLQAFKVCEEHQKYPNKNSDPNFGTIGGYRHIYYKCKNY